MDIPRPEFRQRKRIRRALMGSCAALLIVAAAFGVFGLEPAVPAVPRSSVWVDTVRQGEMLRQVRMALDTIHTSVSPALNNNREFGIATNSEVGSLKNMNSELGMWLVVMETKLQDRVYLTAGFFFYLSKSIYIPGV